MPLGLLLLIGLIAVVLYFDEDRAVGDERLDNRLTVEIAHGRDRSAFRHRLGR
jgi:hypothetical protein